MKALQITQSNFGYWIVIYIPKESNSKMSNRQLSKVQRCCIFLLTTGQENRQLVITGAVTQTDSYHHHVGVDNEKSKHL